MIDSRFHIFSSSVENIDLPKKFTYPFYYVPHQLCKIAANEVFTYLANKTEWGNELSEGKMFGVLVVLDKNGCLGFLSAFSGLLTSTNNHEYFVPPVFDLLDENCFFQKSDNEISALNKQIEILENSSDYLNLKQELFNVKYLFSCNLEKYKSYIFECKKMREFTRKTCHLSTSQLDWLTNESQFQKAEVKRLKNFYENKIEEIQQSLSIREAEIHLLKQKRKTYSSTLQFELFNTIKLLNAKREQKTIAKIFNDYLSINPPSGAGDCCAPKLLQYAYLSDYKPIAMAEFWYGNSPKYVFRRHGCFYPACLQKCKPILNFMLEGLQLEDNALLASNLNKINVVYDDNYLAIIEKPAGLQSVRGKLDVDCVYNQVVRLFPNATGPLIVHRLDMATSGLMIIAKSKEIYYNLQQQFKNRTIKKRYITIVEKVIASKSGIINLPLCLNPNDRPRQIVDYTYGKQAITEYQLLETKNGLSRIAFYPHTGRTHQLRVHAAHPKGLDAPIVGDMLYGHAGERLMLHAESIEFYHPVLKKYMKFCSEVPF